MPTFFCTLRLLPAESGLLITAVADLRRAVRETKALRPFTIDAITVLPSVVHLLMTLPDGTPSPTSRIEMLKSRFSRSQPIPVGPDPAQVQQVRTGIWQRHTWTHRIEDDADYRRHRDLVYLSPVHAGLCARPEDWQHTSLHRDRARDMPETGKSRLRGPRRGPLSLIDRKSAGPATAAG